LKLVLTGFCGNHDFEASQKRFAATFIATALILQTSNLVFDLPN
jgi:hypothetical protein